jgi:hypothetical protein
VRAFSRIVKPQQSCLTRGSGQEKSHEIKAAAVSRAFSSHNSWEECKRSTGRGSVSKTGGSRNAAILSTTPPRWATSCARTGGDTSTNSSIRSATISRTLTSRHACARDSFSSRRHWKPTAVRRSMSSCANSCNPTATDGASSESAKRSFTLISPTLLTAI